MWTKNWFKRSSCIMEICLYEWKNNIKIMQGNLYIILMFLINMLRNGMSFFSCKQFRIKLNVTKIKKVELDDLAYEHFSNSKTKYEKNKTSTHNLLQWRNECMSYKQCSSNVHKLNIRLIINDMIYENFKYSLKSLQIFNIKNASIRKKLH